MGSTKAGGRLAIVAVTAAALAATTGGAAGAAGHNAPERNADIRLVYSAPQISADGTSVTWRWTVTNAGTSVADDVVVSHELVPDEPIKSVTAPCKINTGAQAKIVCPYGTITPGTSSAGTVTTGEPKQNLSTMRITGQVTWQERTLTVVGKSAR